MTENRIIANNGSSIALYTTDDGSTQLEVKLEKDTVWLTQSQMAELFGIDRTTIVRHIRNVYKSEELEESSTCAKNAQAKKNTLVALTLMIAESRTEEKDVMVKVVVNLINKDNQ